MGSKKTQLTAMQARFVAEFMISRNATNAAELAGYAKPNKKGPWLRWDCKAVAQAIESAELKLQEGDLRSVEQKARDLELAMAAIRRRATFSAADCNAYSKLVETHSQLKGEWKTTIDLKGEIGLEHLLTGVHQAVALRERAKQEAGANTPAEGSA